VDAPGLSPARMGLTRVKPKPGPIPVV